MDPPASASTEGDLFVEADRLSILKVPNAITWSSSPSNSVAGPNRGTSNSIAARNGLEALPTELLQNIISFLDSDQGPSSQKLRHEPSSSLLVSEYRPLKCLSLTNRYLRLLAMGSLFRFASIEITVNDFLSNVVIKNFLAFVAKYQLHVHSVAIWFVLEEQITETGPLSFAARICSRIMHALEPVTLTVIAPPTVLPHLVHRTQWNMEQVDAWAFDSPLQVLSCSRAYTEQNPGNDDTAAGRSHSWERAWSSTTLNEGSSVKVYSSYEYYLKTFPSIFTYTSFQAYIGRNWSDSLRSFTYIALFPTSTHVSTVYRNLGFLHNLKDLSVQFAPTEESNVLSDPERIGKCQISDCWMEFRECLVKTLHFARIMSSERKLMTLTFLDWYRYDTATMIMPDLVSVLRGWTFESGRGTKPEQ